MKWIEVMAVTLMVIVMMGLFYQAGRLMGMLEAFAQMGAGK